MKQLLSISFIKNAAILLVVFFTSSHFIKAQPLAANFSSDIVSGCSPIVVNFQDLSTGNPTEWKWDFGNGNTSELKNPTATYFTPGTYSVKLTIMNAAGGINSITKTAYLTVFEPPTVNYQADNSTGCFPLRVQFTDMSAPGLGNNNIAWNWDFGNNRTSAEQSPSFTYDAEGSYSVTLKVTNDKGCSRTVSRINYITVTPGVNASFSNTMPTVCSAPATISFTNSSTGPGTLTYQWLFGDGKASTFDNPTNIYTSDGTYKAILIVKSSIGCIDTAFSFITIGGPVTSFNIASPLCSNSNISFINNSKPAPKSSIWDFGNGRTSSQINGTTVYATAGTYRVKLYNTYANCIDSTAQTITILDAPLANFTAPERVRCEPPLTVSFQNQSSSTATGWEWDFGDGTTSTEKNPTHTYTSFGNFKVTLVAKSSSGCSTTEVKDRFIQVGRPVIENISFPNRGCIPFSISPLASISSLDGIASYQWNFGDGATSTEKNPTHTYTTQGTYDITLIITSNSGCSEKLHIPMAVKVGTKPMANFVASPLVQCVGQSIQFTDLSVSNPPINQWFWDFGDGETSNLQNPTHGYGFPGTYTVSLIAINNGCADTMTKINYITIKPPTSIFSYDANCDNRKEFTFTDLSIGALTWHWDFGDGTTSTERSPTHLFPALGTFSVTLTVTNGSCIHRSTQIIRAIDTNPDIISSQNVACKSANISFTPININPSNIIHYFFDFGDGEKHDAPSPNTSHVYNKTGTYSVRLITMDINGCFDTIVKPDFIRINGPIAFFSATNVAGCAGLTTTFNDESTTDGQNALQTWLWDFGDGQRQTYTSTIVQHTYTASGLFSVKLIVTDASGCKDSIRMVNLIQSTDPKPDFISPDSLSCPGATVNFINNSNAINFSSSWDLGNGDISTEKSPSTVYIKKDFYTVRLAIEDMFGCRDTLIKQLYIRVDTPHAAFNPSNSASACLPFKVQFTNTSTYASSYEWNFGDGGQSTLENPIHFYTTPATHTAMLIAISPGGCRDTARDNIILFDTVGLRLRYSPLSGCKPISIDLSNNFVGNATRYVWDFGDGNLSTTTIRSNHHTYTTFGDFVPKLIIEDPGGCKIPVPGQETVHVIGANANFGYDRTLICDSGFVAFTDSTTTNDPILSYHWDFGDGNTSSTIGSINHYYDNPGFYPILLAVQTQSGCVDTARSKVPIKLVNSPVTSILGPTSICVGGSLLHTGSINAPDTSAITWSWHFPNGNSANVQSPISQTYKQAGDFLISSIVTNSSGCKDTNTHPITIHPLPEINLPGTMTLQTGFPLSIPVSYSPNVTSWWWTPSTGLSCNNCPVPVVSTKFNTTYKVQVVDDNGCKNTAPINVIVICKNANLFIPNTFSPNGDGSNDIFYPRGKGLYNIKVLRIFNRWGEVVFEKLNFPPNDAASGWNGTVKGQRPQPDVYVFQAEVFCDNGDTIFLNGNISLIL